MCLNLHPVNRSARKSGSPYPTTSYAHRAEKANPATGPMIKTRAQRKLSEFTLIVSASHHPRQRVPHRAHAVLDVRVRTAGRERGVVGADGQSARGDDADVIGPVGCGASH